MAVVVTVGKDYDLGYVWKHQAHREGAEQTVCGYYINAARAGGGTGRWWGRAQPRWAVPGQVVERAV